LHFDSIQRVLDTIGRPLFRGRDLDRLHGHELLWQDWRHEHRIHLELQLVAVCRRGGRIGFLLDVGLRVGGVNLARRSGRGLDGSPGEQPADERALVEHRYGCAFRQHRLVFEQRRFQRGVERRWLAWNRRGGCGAG
jgi:hypothetical protein